ncbi:MAG: glycosyltransferase involved in cell wall biosynthesis [Psychroserpens sp.]|jgi:glycosyltransferase involved in cell wall biosynthesis
MKIAFDNKIFNIQSYGGVSRYYTSLAQELLKKNQDVGFFVGAHINNYLEILPNDAVRGMKLNSYPPKMSRIIIMLNNYFTNMQINNWQPEIVHETYYSSTPLHKTKAPRITTIHDMIHELYPKMFSANDKTTNNKRNTFDRVDHIISVSQNSKNDLIELFGVEEDKISVIHLGVDPSFFNFSSQRDSALQRPFLLYVGSRGGYKNFHSVLQAISNSNRLRNDFDLVAFGGGRFSRKESEVISSLGLDEKHVRQTGGDDKKLKELYHLAAAFIYPSLYEGFGIPPLEAMACSCPVISSNTSSMPEVIGDAGEYFDPTDVDELKVAIENVVYSSIRTEELKLLGQNRIKAFSWEKTAKSTLDVYQRMLG